MDAVRKNELRVTCFTNSQIYNLVSEGTTKGSVGKGFHTYIKQKKYERKAGRSLSKETDAKALSWGKLCEKYVLENVLDTSYQLVSDVTLQHPTIKEWAGTPDTIRHLPEIKKITDLKCPFTMLSFCDFAESKTIDEAVKNHKDAIKYKWQITGNGILTNLTAAELIVFCPYYEELDAIIKIAGELVDEGHDEYKWVLWADKEELPYLIKGKGYKNLHIIEFDIPQADIDFLTGRVLEAVRLLNA